MSDEDELQVEAIGPGRLKDAGYNLAPEDRVTVPRPLAEYWCGLGWAKAIDGSIETGERRVVRATVSPQPAKSTQTTQGAS